MEINEIKPGMKHEVTDRVTEDKTAKVMGIGDHRLLRITLDIPQICQEGIDICPVLCLFSVIRHTVILS